MTTSIRGHEASTMPNSAGMVGGRNAAAKPTDPFSCIDVWRVRLDEPVEADRERSVLSPDEIVRATRFRFEQDRIHFVRCRSTLRSLLGSYLVLHPAEIRFEYLASGKPQIAAEQNPHGLQFNVSHSADVALIAVGDGANLGVDIERIRYDVDTSSLAERFFSFRERAGLRVLPDHLRVLGFFACWTRKEAFLKETGAGLSFSLADFSVTTHPDLDPELEEVRGNTKVPNQWFMADLTMGDGYRAAVAAHSSYSHVKRYDWN